MTLYQFNSLLEDEKTAAVWSKGEFIADRQENSYRVLLYQLNSFYVELFYNGNENEIKKCRSFCSIDQLDPYLVNIPVPLINGVI